MSRNPYIILYSFLSEYTAFEVSIFIYSLGSFF